AESIEGGKAGRIRLSLIGDYCGKTLKDFIAANTALGSTILTDGFSSYPGMNERYHEPKVVGTMAAHVLLPWIHRLFSNLKRLGLGVYHGFRKAHMGRFRSRGEVQSHIIRLRRLFRHPRSEPIARSGRFLARSNSHSVAVRDGNTNIPLAAVGAQEDETILFNGFSSHALKRFVHPDPP